MSGDPDTPLLYGIVARLKVMSKEVDSVENQAGKLPHQATIQSDAELDLRGVICPYNFVKTKLKLDTMRAGEVLSVFLDEGEPIRNVPLSVSNEGHDILLQELVEESYYRVFIKKGGDHS